MEKEHRGYTIAVYPAEGERLPFGELEQPEYERQEHQQYACRAYKALFFAHGAEDEVGVLLGHKLQLGLCSVEEALAFESARTDGYLTLVHIVAGSIQVFVQSEQHIDTHALVRLHHIVQYVVG